MEHIGEPPDTGDQATALREALAAGQLALAAAIQVAGGVAAWWRQQGLGEPPASLTEEQLLGETLSFWDWAADRERLCQHCPPYGGACAGPTELFRGRRLGLHVTEPRYVAAKCPRWIEHVQRDWLTRSGVEPRNLGLSLDTFETTEASLMILDAFIETVCAGGERWLIVSGPHGAGKTHLSVGLLREIKRRQLHRECWYQNFLSVPRELKEFYSNERDTLDPLARVREAPLLVLENLPARQPAWLQSAIEEALAVRWQYQRATVITSTSPVPQLISSLAALTGLGSTAVTLQLGAR